MNMLFLLAALSAQAGERYDASGSNPDWTLSIRGDRLRFEDSRKTRIIVPTPAVRRTAEGRRYEMRKVAIDVRYAPCRDARSGRTYADTVTVRYGRRVVHGCGGAPA